MSSTFIANHASFEYMRYAQLWEDSDVLHRALARRPGGHAGHDVVSITAAGDNALGMLLLNPRSVISTDISHIQQHALRLRIAAIAHMNQPEFLKLMGFDGLTNKKERQKLFDRAMRHCEDSATTDYWEQQRHNVIKHGLAGVGKFENFFRIFRQYILPLAHSKYECMDLMQQRDTPDRARFYDQKWNNWRWKLLVKTFFSEPVVARMGRDPAFFAMSVGHLPTHIANRIRHALVHNDPSTNPYLSYILFGRHINRTTQQYTPQNYGTIQQRLDRIDIRQGSIEDIADSLSPHQISGWNLSDIFEYMPLQHMQECYDKILRVSCSEARIVYWNMMVDRSAPKHHIDNGIIEPNLLQSKKLHQDDQTFFYKAFHADRVIRPLS